MPLGFFPSLPSGLGRGERKSGGVGEGTGTTPALPSLDKTFLAVQATFLFFFPDKIFLLTCSTGQTSERTQHREHRKCGSRASIGDDAG